MVEERFPLPKANCNYIGIKMGVINLELIPAIDLMDGCCVRLWQGKKEKKQVFSQNPPEMALNFQKSGASRLHIVDLDGAFSGEIKNLPVIEKIVANIDIPVQVGGGIRHGERIVSLLDVGVDRVILGTKAFTDKAFLKKSLEEHGEKIVVGVDVWNKKVSIKGWTQTSQTNIEEFVTELEDLGCKRIIVTDISKDGALSGPNVHLLEEMMEETKMKVILSGGISSLEDLKILNKVETDNFEGVIIGTSLYKNKFTLEQALEVTGKNDL